MSNRMTPSLEVVVADITTLDVDAIARPAPSWRPPRARLVRARPGMP